MNEKCAIGNLSHVAHAVIPLTFVFNEFNILTQGDDSIEAG
jgi:hypothetical protein